MAGEIDPDQLASKQELRGGGAVTKGTDGRKHGARVYWKRVSIAEQQHAEVKDGCTCSIRIWWKVKCEFHVDAMPTDELERFSSFQASTTYWSLKLAIDQWKRLFGREEDCEGFVKTLGVKAPVMIGCYRWTLVVPRLAD